jgi:hypothetical protein
MQSDKNSSSAEDTVCPVCGARTILRGTPATFLNTPETLPITFQFENGHIFVVPQKSEGASAGE